MRTILQKVFQNRILSTFISAVFLYVIGLKIGVGGITGGIFGIISFAFAYGIGFGVAAVLILKMDKEAHHHCFKIGAAGLVISGLGIATTDTFLNGLMFIGVSCLIFGAIVDFYIHKYIHRLRL